jgi:hypothetical protein
MSKNTLQYGNERVRLVYLIARVVCVVNLALIGLLLLPWFGGTSKKPGLADTLFGAIRLGGFRGDFVWLAVTSILVVTIPAAIKSSSARITAGLCLVEMIAFAFLVFYSLISGTLYFG